MSSQGREAQDGHLDFYTDPELCWQAFEFSLCCFTSTETIRAIGDGKPRTATSTFTQLPSSDVYGYLKLSEWTREACTALVVDISGLLLKSLNF